MQITRAGEYGVLGLLHLAVRPVGQVVMVEEVCREQRIPKSFLSKIFQLLARAGLIRSSRGSGGGFALSRPPEEITVLQVIEAIEGPIALQRCLQLGATCENVEGCALCGLLGQAQDRMKEVLSQTTLADLARKHACLPRSSRSADQPGAAEQILTH